MSSQPPAPPAPRRAHCPRCLRPQAACLCDLVVPVPHETEVLLLQHPQEQRQPKNSVGLLRLSLQRCEWVVGERWSPNELQALLHRPGRHSVLLYPDVPSAPAASLAPPLPARQLRLVVIDATWRKSLKMLHEHPALAALPRLALAAPPATRYRAIRAARRDDQVSTLEATVHALTSIAGPCSAGQSLLDAFTRFVDRTRARHLGSATPHPQAGCTDRSD